MLPRAFISTTGTDDTKLTLMSAGDWEEGDPNKERVMQDALDRSLALAQAWLGAELGLTMLGNMGVAAGKEFYDDVLRSLHKLCRGVNVALVMRDQLELELREHPPDDGPSQEQKA